MSAARPRYGAEELEARYFSSASLSFGIALALVLLVVAYPYIRHLLERPGEEKITTEATRVINYSELQAPPPIELERRIPEPVEAPPKAKTVRFLQPVAKADDEVPEETMPTRDELQDALIGTQDVEGVDSIFVEQTELIVQPEPVEEKPSEIFDFVEVMPEFVGGEDAFRKYLLSNLRYPGVAREAEIQGRVFISFVIERDGSITEVQVVRSVHPLLDDEAVRVISAMPPWVPGMQQSETVRVRFTLPVTFQLR